MMRPQLVPVFLVILVDLLAVSVILPLLPFYAESFGASPAVVGLLLSVFAVCQLLAGPPPISTTAPGIGTLRSQPSGRLSVTLPLPKCFTLEPNSPKIRLSLIA